MGCKVCRARKVKCDGRAGICLNCERLGLSCDAATTSAELPEVPPSPARRRTYRSCGGCRKAKTKCDGKRPVCGRCLAKSCPCVYNAASQPRWTKSLGGLAAGSPSEDEPVDSVMVDGSFCASEGTVGHDATTEAGPIAYSTANDATISVNDGFSTIFNPMVYHEHDHIHESISWLWNPQPPSTPDLLRILADHYFKNVHPIRCFAFLHKPTLMRQLDLGIDFRENDVSALYHIVFALGAKFYVLDYSSNIRPLSAKMIRSAGSEWAKTAEKQLIAGYGRVSVPNLMTAVLLYDYHYRLGQYAHALILSGVTTRMAHGLQLNLEYTAGSRIQSVLQSCTEAESRKRLMWACYVIDVWVGSGVDQLTLIREADLHIRLPCNERDFILQKTSQSLLLSELPHEHAGMMASYIHLVSIWKRVARYVKHLDKAKLPWLQDSEFSQLRSELNRWRSSLPPDLDFTQAGIYTRLESSQLGALTLLHCTYHNAVLDLYRIAIPDLFKLRHAFVFPPRQAKFVTELRNECYKQACQKARVLAEAAKRGPRHLSDSMTPMFSYNSSRILLYFLAKVFSRNKTGVDVVVEEAIGLIKSNIQVLKIASLTMPISEPLMVTTEKWLLKLQTGFSKTDQTAHFGPSDPADVEDEPTDKTLNEPPVDTPDDVLHPLSLFRLARKAVDIRESGTSLPPLRETNEERDLHRSLPQLNAPSSNQRAFSQYTQQSTILSASTPQNNIYPSTTPHALPTNEAYYSMDETMNFSGELPAFDILHGISDFETLDAILSQINAAQ